MNTDLEQKEVAALVALLEAKAAVWQDLNFHFAAGKLLEAATAATAAGVALYSQDQDA